MELTAKKSKLLTEIEGIKHGFFSRNGGISTGDYNSLNCSPSSDDAIENVMKNRQRVLDALELGKLGKEIILYGLNQIHSTRIFIIKKGMPSGLQDGFRDGDAMITTDTGVALSVLTADCAPVLFSASNLPIVAVAHAGWGGAVKGIIKNVVDEMCKLGAEKQAITACIGPTIHQQSYQVREDFIQQLNDLSDFNTNDFLDEKEGRFYFDLPKYIEKQCERSGIVKVENLGLDTYVLEDEFFSFRRNTHAGNKDYGRQISVIGITDNL